ncbi:sarcosine oxidase subunit beta [Agrobacterium tumefaciens]|jgi:sarcosine oxidase subunit beta|nr:sarcosine oxidase subunit beta [Agrobacterium radiobacter]MBB4319134.1 sarcosine oxidase subunit beta [Agrobacterium radiobacter]MBB4335960.1 sarcosine oxidase subunit beta [Agrobacterium radiobacter]MBB4457485.1 sarcosine oxidase subunit beta [Agrobacterium radiobacter]MBB4462098.1 sarcosine oxidase subunit beta [Agrobacterium radiobacter]
MMRNTLAEADVIIVGGGIVGTATAFFLRQRGVSVILLERFLVGQQASGTNFGNVRRQGRYLGQLPLANRSRDIWSRIPQLTGADVEFMPVGHIRFLWAEEQIAVVEKYRDDATQYGLELQILSREAVRQKFPFIGPEAVAGSWSPHDGHANPRLVAPAFARAARRDGATIVENCEVLAIEKAGEDFRVTTEEGEYRAPSVLVANGAWGGGFAGALGEAVPLEVAGPQMGVTEPLPWFIHPVVGVSTKIPGEVIYMRQIPRGNVIFGGVKRCAAALDERRAKYDPAGLDAQLRQLLRLAPALRHARLIRTWSGVEGYMADDLPVMGGSAATSGLYYAFGFSGHGFQIGPGVGDVMAELIATGKTTTPIADFHIGRFHRGESVASH